MGAESYVYGTLPDNSIIVARVPGRSSIQIGETLTLAADPSRFTFSMAMAKGFLTLKMRHGPCCAQQHICSRDGMMRLDIFGLIMA